MPEFSFFFFEGFLMGTCKPKGRGIAFTPFQKYPALQHLKSKVFPDEEYLHEAVVACFSPDEIRGLRSRRARIDRQIEEERFGEPASPRDILDDGML
jgi:hypothetical protein